MSPTNNSGYSSSPSNLVAGIASRQPSAFGYFYWRYFGQIQKLIGLLVRGGRLSSQRSQPSIAVVFWALGFVLESIRNLHGTPSRVMQSYGAFDQWVNVVANQSLTLQSTLNLAARNQQAKVPVSRQLEIQVSYLPCDMQLSGDHVAFRSERSGEEVLVLLADMEFHGPTPALQTTAVLHAFHILNATISTLDMMKSLATSLESLLAGDQPSFYDPTYPSCLLARFEMTQSGIALCIANHGTNRLWYVPSTGPVVSVLLDSSLLGFPGEHPATWKQRLQRGDQVVMATDGLWGEIMPGLETFLDKNRGSQLHTRLEAEAKALREKTEVFAVDDVTFLTFTSR